MISLEWHMIRQRSEKKPLSLVQREEDVQHMNSIFFSWRFCSNHWHWHRRRQIDFIWFTCPRLWNPTAASRHIRSYSTYFVFCSNFFVHVSVAYTTSVFFSFAFFSHFLFCQCWTTKNQKKAKDLWMPFKACHFLHSLFIHCRRVSFFSVIFFLFLIRDSWKLVRRHIDTACFHSRKSNETSALLPVNNLNFFEIEIAEF